MRQLEEQAALKQLLRASNAGEPAAVARLDALTKVIFAAMPGSLAATPGFWVLRMSFLYKLDDASLAALMLLIICLLTLFCRAARGNLQGTSKCQFVAACHSNKTQLLQGALSAH